MKKHKRKRSPSPSPSSSLSIVSSSCSSSSRQRSPARKRSRSRSRSSSSAEENSHVPAPRAVSPSLLRDGISLCADDDDQFNSHSEEHQDLIPDTEIRSNASDIHSNMSSEDMKFQNLIEEVFELLPADRFPRKTEGVLGGNKPHSSIEMELMKAQGKAFPCLRQRVLCQRPLIVLSSPWVRWSRRMVLILCLLQLPRTGCLQNLISISL